MPWNPEYYQPKIWNTGLAAERARAKNKSEPPADKKKIKKLHDAWAKANGYKPQASSSKRQASSALKKTQS